MYSYRLAFYKCLVKSFPDLNLDPKIVLDPASILTSKSDPDLDKNILDSLLFDIMKELHGFKKLNENNAGLV
jgi:hypothetical protein